MAQPEVVKRKLEEAENLMQAQAQQGTPVQQAQAPVDAPVVAQPQPTATPQTPVQGTPEAAPTAAAQPQPEPQPQAQPTAQPGDVNLDQITDPAQLKSMLVADEAKYAALEHKFNVLKGKEYAEVPRLNARVQQLEQMNMLLQQQVVQTQQGVGQPGNPNQQAPHGQADIDLKQWYPQEVIDSYDKEILEAQVRNQQKSESKFINELEPLKRQVAETQNAMFTNQIRAAVPNYDALNNDPAFLSWLEEPVYPGASATRQQMLDGEVQGRNVSGIASVFAQYVPAQPQPHTLPHNVHQQIAPQSAGAIAQPAAPTQGRVYSGAEYSALMSKAVTGQSIPGFNSATELKQELDAALSQGRVSNAA